VKAAAIPSAFRWPRLLPTFAESLAKGQPNREKIALTVLSDKVRELV
jgi:hypothetical protein